MSWILARCVRPPRSAAILVVLGVATAVSALFGQAIAGVIDVPRTIARASAARVETWAVLAGIALAGLIALLRPRPKPGVPTAALAPERPVILLVEDEAEYRNLLAEFLAAGGFRPIAVDRLSGATARVVLGGIDAILLDLSLPDSRGIETVRRLAEAAAGIPIVVLTGVDDEDLALEAVRAGAQDYLAKLPLDRALLVRTIRHSLERQRLQLEVQRQRELLYQHDKIAAMGQLLAGVAHELNNPLAVIAGDVALLQRGARDPRLAARAARLEQAVGRCTRIVRNFLALARQHPPERVAVDLNRVVREGVELLAYPLRVDNMDVRLALDPELPSLDGDPHQLHQVVVNLVSNAHQALRETAGPRQVTVRTRVADARVVLEVADNGPGIPPELQSRIFEPFFTTKPVGQGTGLGLPLCLGIVEQHGGTLRVESAPGGGSVFVAELPVAACQPSRPAVPAPRRSPRALGGARTILVVDDEPAIGEIVSELLTDEGYTVETAANAALALERLDARAFDLVLCDVRMPVLDGRALYRALAGRDAGRRPRLIFMTGDGLGHETREFLETTAVPAVSKPLDFDELLPLVRRVLAGPAGSPAGEPRLLVVPDAPRPANGEGPDLFRHRGAALPYPPARPRLLARARTGD
jgi:signal transduction histidine kinase